MKLETRMMVERMMIRKLVRTMKKAGWVAVSVYDGEEHVRCKTEAEVMDNVFGVDEAGIRFQNEAGNRHSAAIVLGNDGYDCIADWGYAEGDPDGFNALMETVAFSYGEKLQERFA